MKEYTYMVPEEMMDVFRDAINTAQLQARDIEDQESNPADTAIKNDSDKPDLSLCPKPALDGMARALMFGAKKYSRNNYRNGFARTRLLGAALRHITAYSFGEDSDPESGLSHLDHALASLAMLVTNIAEGKSNDDR